MPKFLEELENCKLCEWQCGVDRLSGELGVCKMGVPQVASCQLHPAPPQSYTIFTAGCNFKCLNCQNCFIAHYPDIETPIRGYVDPKELAIESIVAIKSSIGKLIGADRIFFSGGEPTIHLPYIEKIVEEARKIDPETKVNFDTNGFLTWVEAIEERDNVLRILKETKRALERGDASKLRLLSDQTINTASRTQDPDNIAVAVIVYSLSKIIEMT